MVEVTGSTPVSPTSLSQINVPLLLAGRIFLGFPSFPATAACKTTWIRSLLPCLMARSASYPSGVTGRQIAESIGTRLANRTRWRSPWTVRSSDLARPLDHDATVHSNLEGRRRETRLLAQLRPPHGRGGRGAVSRGPSSASVRRSRPGSITISTPATGSLTEEELRAIEKKMGSSPAKNSPYSARKSPGTTLSSSSRRKGTSTSWSSWKG